MTLHIPTYNPHKPLPTLPPKRGTEHLYGDCPVCGKYGYLWGKNAQGQRVCINCIPKPPAPKATVALDLSAYVGKKVYQDTGDPNQRVEAFLAQWRASRAMSASAWHMMDAPATPAPYMPARGAEIEDIRYLTQYEWTIDTANRQLGQQAQALKAFYQGRYDWKSGEIRKVV